MTLCQKLISRGADRSIRNQAGERADSLIQIPSGVPVGSSTAGSSSVSSGPEASLSVNPAFVGGIGNEERIFLEASRSGDIDTVKRLCRPGNVNCRDFEGRQSTPLHFAAGYNRVEVVEFLLQMGADVLAKDKGGLVPLHNACSYGHLEVKSDSIVKVN